MKNFNLLPLLAIFALAVSCEKAPSEADKNAQVEREVQQRLAAERQADDQKRLAQQQADLEAREKALAAKEGAATPETTESTTTFATETRTDEETDSTSRVASSDREAPRSYDTFYRKLEPYGAWRETDDYGFVWQPRQAQTRDWRPYTNGRWAYTDAGWTWVSEEPFGWATYHYGRWTRLRNVGWVWVPGEEWAPAWVSWRTGDKNVGWAPLPPEARFERNTGIKKWADSYYDISADEYVFIPNEDIGSERIESAIIPVDRNVAIVNETTNVTNITYNNTTIVNEGPNFDQLRGHSRRPIERMRLERQYNVQQDAAPQAVVRGSVLSVVTPMFTARATQRPRNLGEPIRQAQVERNWTNNANQPEADRARARMKAEATPPPNVPPKRFEKPTVLPPSASPAPSVAASTPQPLATASAAPIVATPTPTPRVTASPIATATAAVTATATPTPRPSFTPRPMASPRTTPVAPTASPTVAATATPAVAASPVATATPTPRPMVPTATPRITPAAPIPSPTSTVAATPVTAQPSASVAGDRQRRPDNARKPAAPPVAPTTASPVVVPSPAAAVATPPVTRAFTPRPTLAPRPQPPTASPAESVIPLQEGVPNAKRNAPIPPPVTAPAAAAPAAAAGAAAKAATAEATPVPRDQVDGKKEKRFPRPLRPGEKAEPEPTATP